MQFISRRPLSEFLEFVSIYTYKLYSNYFYKVYEVGKKKCWGSRAGVVFLLDESWAAIRFLN